MGKASQMSLKGLLIACTALLIFGSCTSDLIIDFGVSQENEQGLPGIVPPQSESRIPEWFQVYFTEPETPHADTLRGGPDAALAEAIDRARLSVDIAMDGLELWSLRDALLAAHRRGVVVRVVVESDNLTEEEVQALVESGIPAIGDRREGLMHNKFVIIDRQDVWTGSMNYTLNGSYRSNNNLIRVRSAELAEDYLAEFNEMFVEHRFGPGSPANTPFQVLKVDETRLEVFFSPDDGTIKRLIELVRDAKNEILFMAYSFTDEDLAQAMLERAESGVDVVGVLDESQAWANIGGVYELLLENGVDANLDGIEGSMHHKVIIIDGHIVVTGSYNFSNSAKTSNDENTLILHSPEIAALYKGEFERIYAQAK